MDWILKMPPERGDCFRRGEGLNKSLAYSPPFKVDDNFSVVGRKPLASGGCGIVYRAKKNDSTGQEVALKCLKDIPEEDRKQELGTRFLKEIEFLSANQEEQEESLPRIFGHGKLRDGRPYYAMELLQPAQISEGVLLPGGNDDDRIQCLLDILESVAATHKRGYIHGDIKPANVMLRQSDNRVRYLLVDFGTVHKIEVESRDLYHHGTKGYDAPEKSYGVGRDIFGIGQVIRDMFSENVPIKWSLIINRCISRRPEYRYQTIDELRQDIVRIDELGRQEMEARILEWRTKSVAEQKELVDAQSDEMKWGDLLLLRKAHDRCAEDEGLHVGDNELLIDFAKLKRKSLSIADAAVLDKETLIVIKGPGVLRADISPVTRDRRVVVLMNQVTLIDLSCRLPQTRNIVYCIGEHCYVNLKNITKGVALPASSYRLSSAGDAFIRCGGPDRVADIVSRVDGVLWADRSPVVEDELFGEGLYRGCKKGLARYIWDSNDSDGKIEGAYLQAMGVQLPILSEQLNAAIGQNLFAAVAGRTDLLPLGAIVGAICGSWYKTHRQTNVDKIELFHEPSRLPVDGEMTLAVAAALCGAAHQQDKLENALSASMRIFGRVVPFSFGKRFQDWIFDEDLGPNGSWGNGAVMRVSPCAWAAKTLDQALSLAECVTTVTHNSSEALKGAKAVTEAIFIAREMRCGRRRKNKDDIYAAVAQYYPEMSKSDFTIEQIKPAYGYDESCAGTVPYAIRAFYESSDFENAVRLAISLGGDADTLADVTGAIAEAYYGIPVNLSMQACGYLDEMRRSILARFSGTYGRTFMERGQ